MIDVPKVKIELTNLFAIVVILFGVADAHVISVVLVFNVVMDVVCESIAVCTLPESVDIYPN